MPSITFRALRVATCLVCVECGGRTRTATLGGAHSYLTVHGGGAAVERAVADVLAALGDPRLEHHREHLEAAARRGVGAALRRLGLSAPISQHEGPLVAYTTTCETSAVELRETESPRRWATVACDELDPNPLGSITATLRGSWAAPWAPAAADAMLAGRGWRAVCD